jgi:hypothetical protein
VGLDFAVRTDARVPLNLDERPDKDVIAKLAIIEAIGQRCFIGHGVMFANDMFRDGKPNADRDSWGRIETAPMRVCP